MTANAVFDYEAKSLYGGSNTLLEMTATDGTSTATAVITINIGDVNDNAIKCTPMFAYANIAEDAAASMFISSVM